MTQEPDQLTALFDSLGALTQEEADLVSAALTVEPDGRNAHKWDRTAKVVVRALGPGTSAGGVGSPNVKHWNKHGHNRAGQRGFRQVEVSVFVTEDPLMPSEITDAYRKAIQDPGYPVMGALILVRRGVAPSFERDSVPRRGRVARIICRSDYPKLEELRAIAPGAELVLIEPATAGPTASLPPTLPIDTAASQDATAGFGDIGTAWVLLQGSSPYEDVEGAVYHYLRTTRASGHRLQAGDWALCLRSSNSPEPDRGSLFGLARVARVHERGEDRYAIFDLFWRTEERITFDDLGGDPRPTPQNPMTSVHPELIEAWLGRSGLRSVKQMEVPSVSLSLRTLQNLTADLALPPGTIEACLAAVRAGKHLLLTGPPGTGKSTLAIALATAAEEDGLAGPPAVTTGTADWSSVETVGAYRQEPDGSLAFSPGHFLSAIEENSWLVVDELNRADIDKAIGQLFSVLSGHPVELPYRDASDQPISLARRGSKAPVGKSVTWIEPNWRIIATMNERDRDMLFSLSEALMRRFAVVRIGPPDTRERWIDALARGTGAAADVVELFADIATVPHLEIGPAVIQDCIRHVEQRGLLGIEETTTTDRSGAVRESVRLMIEPQLATLFQEDRASVLQAIESVIQESTQDSDVTPPPDQALAVTEPPVDLA